MRESFSELFPPRRIGRYEIVDRLGAGGMAEVLLAVRQGAAGFKKAVALKRILPQYARESQFVAMLAREAHIAAMLHHPNCVQVTELEDVDGDLFIAMELLFGLTLDELALLAERAREPFPIGAAIRIAIDGARGLHYVHTLRDEGGQSLGVVHRDVSPQNLLVTESGVTKILDFGIATAVEVLDGDTRTGALKGKYVFMAPEQVNFQPVDAGTDVWGLAVTLWSLLAGRPLFRDAGLLETLEAIRNAPIPPPSAHRADVPPALDEALLRALDRNPARRTRSAGDFAAALEAVAASMSGTTTHDVAELVRRLGAAALQQLRGRVAGAVRVGAQLAEASGAHRALDDGHEGPRTSPSSLEMALGATAHAAGPATGARATSVERPGRVVVAPGTDADERASITDPDGALAHAPTVAGTDPAARSSPSLALVPGALPTGRGAAAGAELPEATDPIARMSDPLVPPAATAMPPPAPIPAAPGEPSVSPLPSVSPVPSVSPTPLASWRTPGPGTPASSSAGGRRAPRTRHPWWLDVVAIAVGAGLAWAVAEALLRR